MSESAPTPLPLKIDFPEDLPVSARRADIMAAIRDHAVVIVSGETGSGKTTQLPKMALALGRAAEPVSGKGRSRLIGHTQPRRLAATSVAKRVAQELKTELGEVVGYKVRFNDRLSARTRIKLMTDGILLAETQTDPLLKAYDTLIIDEAHERSLNIDFLLGYLKQILPRRPDLKVIITSATIDAERFSKFFASLKGPAPVIEVSGRSFPVEMRYTPFEEARDFSLDDAIAQAVDQLWQGRPNGDILVFLPGEREIREAADHLRQHLSHSPITRGVEVLALFARLSQAEQDRVFDSHSHPRIVLATNVAETSLTVPGIRYVIDTGLARVKRYSYRNKVEQLLVEPISQAAANQRAGRCGRVGPGIAIRLYDEKDFTARPRFTDPEILRSSLAGVILRMHALGLGQVAAFDFLEPPRGKAIADGQQLLVELGALTEDLALTPLGRELSRLPLDPRVGRMLLAARDQQALQEALIIASALSVQDVRDRPPEAQTQADQAHAKFKDDQSEFSGHLRLWQWLHEARGGHGTHKLSNRQYEQLLRQNYLHVRRVREWRDVYSQLHTVVAEHRWPLNERPASYEQLHTALLAGMLGNVGYKLDEQPQGAPAAGQYLGARGIKFYPHPGAHLKKKPGKWVVCAELVETTRLFGRGVANIEPQWLERVGEHLLRRQLLDPHWEKRSGDVIALERATLYGLVVYSGRRTSLAKADPRGARELFIREALVAGDVDADTLSRWHFLRDNLKLVAQVEQLEHKSRRQDVLVDESLIQAFYDQQLPDEVCNVRTLDAWWKTESKRDPKRLHLSRDELMRHTAAGITTEAFPPTLKLGGVDCKTEYLHEPGDAKDGVTVSVPLFVLNQVSEERLEWLVPGLLTPKIQALLKSLPQKPRARLVPLPDAAHQLAQALTAPEVFAQGSLMAALLERVRHKTQLDVKRSDFKLDMVAPHLFMNVRVVDEHGRQLGMGRNLGALKAEWGGKARGAFQALAQLKGLGAVAEASPNEPSRAAGAAPAATRSNSGSPSSAPAQTPASAVAAEQRFTQWTFGELPELMEIRKGNQTLIGFPALVDVGNAVTLEVFDEPELAAAKHRVGLRRLVALQIRDALKYLDKNIPDLQKMAVAYLPLGTESELKQHILDVAVDRAFLQDPWPSSQATFELRVQEGRSRLTLIANEVARTCGGVLAEFATASRKIKDTKNAPDATADAAQQLQRLLTPRFVADTPWAQLQHLPRYLKAITLRLEKWRADPARDAQRLAELKPLEQRFWRMVAERKGAQDTRLQEFRWLLEELRVSLFAQELRTPQPVSVKRLEKAWAQLMH